MWCSILAKKQIVTWQCNTRNFLQIVQKYYHNIIIIAILTKWAGNDHPSETQDLTYFEWSVILHLADYSQLIDVGYWVISRNRVNYIKYTSVCFHVRKKLNSWNGFVFYLCLMFCGCICNNGSSRTPCTLIKVDQKSYTSIQYTFLC